MSAVLLGLAIFTLLTGFMFSYRFLRWAMMKANFASTLNAFAYGFYGSVLLATSAWLFMVLAGWDTP